MICPICKEEALSLIKDADKYICYNCGVNLTEEEYNERNLIKILDYSELEKDEYIRKMLDEWWDTEPFGFDHPDTYKGILELMCKARQQAIKDIKWLLDHTLLDTDTTSAQYIYTEKDIEYATNKYKEIIERYKVEE